MDYNSYLNFPLKESQYEYVDFARMHDYCIIAAKMGKGKTVIGIVTGLISAQRTVVVCPAFLKFNWKKEYEVFAKKKQRVVIVEGKTINKINPLDYDVIILNYNILGRCEKFLEVAGTVIYDEAHYLLNPKAAWTKAAVKFTRKYTPEKLLVMTGTPNKGKGKQWFVPITMCSINPRKNSGIDMRDYYSSFWDFQLRFCNKTVLNVGGREITQFTGIRNVEKLKKFLRGKLIVGKKTEHNFELIFKDVYVDYKTEDTELKKAWEDYQAGNKVEEHIMSAKSAAALTKTSFTADYVKNLLESGEGPIILYTDHRLPLERLKELLGRKYIMETINGSTPMKKRDEFVTAFESGKLDVLAGTVKAMNTGLTLIKSHNMVINDSNWSWTEMEQAYYRFYRIGQTEDCVVHNILGSEVDKNIVRNINRDKQVIEKVLGDME